MLQKNSNKIDGVLAANDGLGNAAVSALKQRKLKQIPVTGQDATTEGLQNILAGDQYMTVYKAIKAEADAASQLAISLAKGTAAPAGLVNGKSDDGARQVPSVLLKPVAVTKDNIKDTVVADGFVKKTELCAGKFAALCTKAGI
jgi:D-xylose transport system substrate-binding protein